MVKWVNSVLLKNKTIQQVVLGQGLLTREPLGHIFLFENLVTEVTPTVVPLA